MLLSIQAVMGTGAVLLVLIGIVSAIIVKMIKDKRQGKSSCSCGCSGCAMKDICHSKRH